MKEDRNSEEKKRPQQHPENPEEQNAQQELEYRKQKEGSLKKLPEQPTDKDAIEKFEDIKADEKKNSEEE